MTNWKRKGCDNYEIHCETPYCGEDTFDFFIKIYYNKYIKKIKKGLVNMEDNNYYSEKEKEMIVEFIKAFNISGRGGPIDIVDCAIAEVDLLRKRFGVSIIV